MGKHDKAKKDGQSETKAAPSHPPKGEKGAPAINRVKDASQKKEKKVKAKDKLGKLPDADADKNPKHPDKHPHDPHDPERPEPREPAPLEVEGGPGRQHKNKMVKTRRGTIIAEDVLQRRKTLRRKSIAATAEHRRKSIIANEILANAVAADKAKTSAEFDGVHWRHSMKAFFLASAKRWPPKMLCGLFCTKGYYQDYSEESQRKSRYFSRYLDKVDSENELTAAENKAYGRAQRARDKGLPEANDWESYESEDSADGHIVKKLRRKSLILRHRNLWESHEERKKEYEKRKEEKRKLVAQGLPYVLPDYSPFVGYLVDTNTLKHHLNQTESTTDNLGHTPGGAPKPPKPSKTLKGATGNKKSPKVAPEHKKDKSKAKGKDKDHSKKH